MEETEVADEEVELGGRGDCRFARREAGSLFLFALGTLLYESSHFPKVFELC